ncbi:hypothetical protein L1987_83384 [Smallanthus sonchifolius]|uniref:Uncharacterized protein n=1 Tax=Smallanthus sonchifolius TaxID=185202 RepID=A0ACB8YCM8_9ASTR|nr:hypothetical protein L1987_83384 [Smallanthus sonchifolius]
MSFSSIMNEMRKKASGDVDKPSCDIIKKIEMNVTLDMMKSTSDINNKIEKNVTGDTMKPDSDITNAIKKNVTTNTMKPDIDINNAIKKNVATDTMKSTSDVNNKMVEKLTKEAMISTTRDVNKAVEENATMDSTRDDVNDDMKDDDDNLDDDDLNYEIEEDTAMDSITDDVDDEMEEDTTVSDDDEDKEEDEVPANGIEKYLFYRKSGYTVTENKYQEEVNNLGPKRKYQGVLQTLVYIETQPLIRSVLDGYNVCIFAYGQTGSGKTFTMTGPDVFSEETMGVNYRSLNDLFEIQQQRRGMINYEVCVQMLEIYNEMVRDLLSADGASKKYPFYGYSCLFDIHLSLSVV